MINYLYILNKQYPNDEWDHEELSANPLITLDLFEEIDTRYSWYGSSRNNKNNKCARWRGICKNPNITLEFIVKHIKLVDGHTLSSQKIITWDFIKTHPEIEWNINEISKNPNITLAILDANYDVPWNWEYLLAQGNILHTDDALASTSRALDASDTLASPSRALSPNNIKKLWQLSRCMCSRWSFYQLISSNPGLTWADVSNDLTAPWDWQIISKRVFVTWEIITTHPEILWHWASVSINPNVTMEIVMANPDRLWSIAAMSNNPNLTIDFVKSHMDVDWNWVPISLHKNITIEIILANPELPWEWYYIARNPNITAEMVMLSPINEQSKYNMLLDVGKIKINDVPTHILNTIGLYYVCKCPDITYQYIIDNQFNFSRGNWQDLSANKFGKDPKLWHPVLRKKYFNKWMRITADNKKYRRDIYNHVVDLLKVRIRDFNDGPRTKLI